MQSFEVLYIYFSFSIFLHCVVCMFLGKKMQNIWPCARKHTLESICISEYSCQASTGWLNEFAKICLQIGDCQVGVAQCKYTHLFNLLGKGRLWSVATPLALVLQLQITFRLEKAYKIISLSSNSTTSLSPTSYGIRGRPSTYNAS